MNKNNTFALIAACGLAAGCASMGISGGPSAVANLEPTNGNTAKGTVSFTQHGDKVRVSAQLSGLKPNAELKPVPAASPQNIAPPPGDKARDGRAKGG